MFNDTTKTSIDYPAMAAPTAPKMAKGVRYHGNHDFRLDDIPMEPLASGQIRLTPAWCGICGTDVKEWQSGPIFPPTPDNPQPLTGDHMPITFGHEFAGTVTEAHSSVTSLKVGDRVAVRPALPDNTCWACQDGKQNLCEQCGFIGLSCNPGGLCESVVLLADSCHKLGANIPLGIGALVEPFTVAWHAVENSGIKPGQSTLVFGAGPIGLAIILCLKAKGITTILVSEPSKMRNAHATRLGVTHVFNPMETDVVAEAKRLCDGPGPHVTFDASGVQATLSDGLKAVRKGGLHYNVALWKSEVSINLNELLFNGKTLKSDIGATGRDFEAVIAAMADGSLPMDQLKAFITSRIELDELEEKGLLELINFNDKHIKILVRVDKTEQL